MTRIRLLAAVLVTLVVVACSSAPVGPPPELVRLDSEMTRLRADVRISGNAIAELERAQIEIDFLHADGRRLDDRIYEHRVYLAGRMVQIAEAEGLARHGDLEVRRLTGEREALLAEARADARIAQAQAADARSDAAAERRRAEDERRAAELAREDATRAQMDLDSLRARYDELQAQRTERGLVVTLGDVLFETGRAELKPGATRQLDQLAQALRSDPATSILIEGHTDSVGGREYNLDLSARRSDTVRGYLVANGISPARLHARGLGPDYPVATNGSDSGRQQNRRVEVIVQQQVARAPVPEDQIEQRR